MQALEIIQAEHRGMWRIATAMDALAQLLIGSDAQKAKASADTIAHMLDYVDDYVDAIHHPKEDTYLFPILRLRDATAATDLDRLQNEHRDGPRYRDELRTKVRAFSEASGSDVVALVSAVQSFANHLRDHIRLEESSVIPLARKALTAQDWIPIDAAFLNNEDPLFGQKRISEFSELKAKIVALAPEPVGFGGSTPLSATEPASPSQGTAGQSVLKIRGITSHYDRIQALHGIDLDVKQGQLVALVGANGAGKTTLLKAVSGVQPVSGGSISLFGQDITRLPPEKRVRLGVCQVPEGRQVFGPMSIEDNLLLGAYIRKDAEVAQDIENMYSLFPILKEKRLLAAGTLSGGQQQMLAMARALLGRPKLLLLDEPSMGLAPLMVEEIFRVIKKLKAEGITILLVEQNAHAALAIADIGYVMETGHTTLTGPGPELLKNEQVRAAYLGM
jgi:branched-chain amino acid transport system ATP-binding protein